MKSILIINKTQVLMSFVLCFTAFTLSAQNTFTEYKGIVVDSDSQNPLKSVNITVKNSNISTITNTEGEFVLKVPESSQSNMVVLSLLGYQIKEIGLNELSMENVIITMSLKAIELGQVNVTEFKSAEALVVKMFDNKSKNYLDQPVLMTAFYRETIKKRNKNVSLTEAVVDLYKQSYQNGSRDMMKLHKARKSTDYKALDTLAFKLQGGPFSTLYLDIMKYPEFIFSNASIPDYNYAFEQPTTVNNKLVYVVNFIKKPSDDPLGFYGKLYIDANSLALTRATYALNIEDKESASDFFVKKKPVDIITYPTETSYKVNYQEKDGKWYYSYASVNLTFKVNKKRKLFNSVYSISSEMAITDWELTSSSENKDFLKDRLKPSIIIADEVSGFSDPDFWGAFNLIEPDKSIESAIDKIRKQLKR